LNRVKLRDGTWLDVTAILRKKQQELSQSGSTESDADVQLVILYARNILPGAGNSPDYLEAGFADFLEAPGIEAIDLSQFSGRLNSRILIHLGESRRASEIQVQIINWDGSLAMDGFAEQGLFSTEWIYSLPKDNPQPWARIRVSVRA
ncbi:MAG TPA: hypothetical protein PK509_02200, partial [Catalimonadaceae bacterium]|nr:hypothetical protein [Catalimonadaceae bacterium]